VAQQKDYVSRGRSGERRKNSSRKKHQSSALSKTMIGVALAAAVAFIGGLYFIAHHKKSEEAQVAATKTARQGSVLPPKPEERWRYIKELETRQSGVQLPKEPQAASDNEAKTPLTPEQRQLLEQIQADMRQAPTQLSEVPYNDQSQVRASTHSPLAPMQSLAPQGVIRGQQSQAPTHSVKPFVSDVPATTNKQKAPMISEAIGEKPPKQALNTQDNSKTAHLVVQCGSFHGSAQAESARAKLAMQGFEARIVTSGEWNRVVIGSYNNRSNAEGTLSRLKNSGISGCIPVASGG
jgi:cell division protein FtsN